MAKQSTSDDAPAAQQAAHGRNTRWNDLPAKTVFDACTGLVRGMGIEKIADMISDGMEQRIHRTQVNKVIAEGVRRGYLRLTPPMEQSLAQELRVRYANARGTAKKPKVINVVTQSYDVSLAQVAGEAAATVFDIVDATFERKNPGWSDGEVPDEKIRPVRVGFGAGSTMTMVAGYLADHMRGKADRPRVNIHSLTAGFRNDEPHTAPNSFCNFFHGIPEVTHTALFSTPYVDATDWDEWCKNTPGVSDSYKESKKIDIIVTALASAVDPHGELNRFFGTYRKLAGGTKRELTRAKRVGDVMHRPYSKNGPIRLEDELRAATLFELEQLVDFAHRDHTAVILVAGPCGAPDCRKSRHRALRPLLEAPALDLWTHLVTDDITARRCLE